MKFYTALVLLFVAVGLHVFALSHGIYEAEQRAGFVWFDNVLHAVVGVALALIWLWFRVKRSKNTFSIAAVLTSLLFVICIAVLWEALEDGFYIFFSTYAYGLKVYPQSLLESVSDASSDVVGALVFLAAYQLRARFKTEELPPHPQD
jgi:hypothetical protein